MSRPIERLSNPTPAMLDDLERRGHAEGLLVRQVPESPGTYEVSDGRAFRACPITILPEEVAKRGRAHDAAVEGRSPPLKKPSASLTPAKELSAPSGLMHAWSFEARYPNGMLLAGVDGQGRTFFAARADAARRLVIQIGRPVEPGDLKLAEVGR